MRTLVLYNNIEEEVKESKYFSRFIGKWVKKADGQNALNKEAI